MLEHSDHPSLDHHLSSTDFSHTFFSDPTSYGSYLGAALLLHVIAKEIELSWLEEITPGNWT